VGVESRVLNPNTKEKKKGVGGRERNDPTLYAHMNKRNKKTFSNPFLKNVRCYPNLKKNSRKH
jgi:hypothetical protein